MLYGKIIYSNSLLSRAVFSSVISSFCVYEIFLTDVKVLLTTDKSLVSTPTTLLSMS